MQPSHFLLAEQSPVCVGRLIPIISPLGTESERRVSRVLELLIQLLITVELGTLKKQDYKQMLKFVILTVLRARVSP